MTDEKRLCLIHCDSPSDKSTSANCIFWLNAETIVNNNDQGLRFKNFFPSSNLDPINLIGQSWCWTQFSAIIMYEIWVYAQIIFHVLGPWSDVVLNIQHCFKIKVWLNTNNDRMKNYSTNTADKLGRLNSPFIKWSHNTCQEKKNRKNCLRQSQRLQFCV